MASFVVSFRSDLIHAFTLAQRRSVPIGSCVVPDGGRGRRHDAAARRRSGRRRRKAATWDDIRRRRYGGCSRRAHRRRGPWQLARRFWRKFCEYAIQANPYPVLILVINSSVNTENILNPKTLMDKIYPDTTNLRKNGF